MLFAGSRANRRGGVLLAAVIAASCTRADAGQQRTGSVDARAMRVHDSVLAGLATLDSALLRLHTNATRRPAPDTLDVRVAFDSARMAYKRIEFAIIGFMPTVEKALNGAPLAEMEEEEGDRPVRPPEGLQVIEMLLPFTTDSAHRIALEATIARDYVARAVQTVQGNRWSDASVLGALRQELAMVAVAGLAHLDAEDADRGLIENAMALQGVQTAMRAYRTDAMRAAPHDMSALDSLLTSTRIRLTTVGETKRLLLGDDSIYVNRLSLLVDGVRPSALALARVRDALHIAILQTDDGWRASSPTPFEADAFDASVFAHASAIATSPLRVALGAQLFGDRRMSRDGARSCDACHMPARAFTDGRATALLLPVRATSRAGGAATAIPARNTPTLINSALQPVQFMDGRVAFLEDQIASVVHNTSEMNGDLRALAGQLAAVPGDRARFAAAFGERGDSTVTAARIQSALAAYLRSLTRLNAPFDRFCSRRSAGHDTTGAARI